MGGKGWWGEALGEGVVKGTRVDLSGPEQRPTLMAVRGGGEAGWGCLYVCRGRKGVERPVVLAHSEAESCVEGSASYRTC